MSTWYVLTTNNPKHAKAHLEQWNITVEENQKRFGDFALEKPIDSFIPYTAIDATVYEPDVLTEKLSIRSALYRYLFVQGELVDVKSLISRVNAQSEDRLFFLLVDQDNKESRATIRPSDLEALIKICSSGEYTIDLPLSVSDLKVGSEIHLPSAPFESDNTTCKIVDVVPKKNGAYKVQLELTLFNIPFQRLFVTLHDVPSDTRFSEIVGNAQKKLVDIFSRKVNDKQTEATRLKDEGTLREILQDCTMPFPPGAMHRHFLALMLICAQMLGDVQTKERLKQQVLQELSAIARLRESKASTDARAYLHVAMYIATREPKYREQARAYIHEHHPASPYLQKLVSTCAKREALKFMGDKANKPK
jgi:hypothetical protein